MQGAVRFLRDSLMNSSVHLLLMSPSRTKSPLLDLNLRQLARPQTDRTVNVVLVCVFAGCVWHCEVTRPLCNLHRFHQIHN